MGFWSTLGKIGGAAGAIAGIPFTGGLSMAALPGILGAGGQIASGLAGGRAEGRQKETENQLEQQRLQQQLFEAITRNQTEQAKFQRDSPTTRFEQAAKGNLAANMQDVQIQVPDRLKPYMVQFSGGLRPSAIGEGGRAAGQKLADIGMSQMGQDQINFPTPPQMGQLPQANWLDKFLSVAGPAASFAGSLPQRPSTPPYQGPSVGGGATPPPGIMPWLPPSPQMAQPVSGITNPDLMGRGFARPEDKAKFEEIQRMARDPNRLRMLGQ